MNFGKDLFREVMEDDLLGGSAELAYRFLFAMFPFFIFLAALSAYVTDWIGVDNPTDQIVSNVGDALPDDAAGVLESQLRGILDGGGAGLLSFGALAALWASSSATKTIMKWMSRVYNVKDDRPFLRKQAVGVALTLLGAAGFLLAAVLLIGGQLAGDRVAEEVGLSGIWATVVSWGRIPAVLLVLMAAMAVIYWLAPNTGYRFRWITPGAVMFVVVWIAATVGFGFYIANFGNYQATYGALAGVIILMLWLYITAFVMLLGGKVNAVFEARRLQTTENQVDAAAIAQRDLDPEIAHQRRIRPDDPQLAPGAHASEARERERSRGDRRRERAASSTGRDGGTPSRHMERAEGAPRGAIASLGAVFGMLALRRVLGGSNHDDTTSSASRSQ